MSQINTEGLSLKDRFLIRLSDWALGRLDMMGKIRVAHFLVRGRGR